MTSRMRPIVVGVVAALAVVAVAAAAWAVAGVREPTVVTDPSKVVVVFAQPGEDGAVVARAVAVVDLKAAAGTYRVVDTSETVTIPGTSYSHVRDAYSFGGAAAVADVLSGGQADAHTAWVEVSPIAWKALLREGLSVTLADDFDTYDETADRYASFVKGPQRVATEDLRSLLNGLAYLPNAHRQAADRQIVSASLVALSHAVPGQGIRTDLSGVGWAALQRALR